ncbi:hypothetical protein BH09PAT2_BH09PAT2_06490 [soil metagenome]
MEDEIEAVKYFLFSTENKESTLNLVRHRCVIGGLRPESFWFAEDGDKTELYAFYPRGQRMFREALRDMGAVWTEHERPIFLNRENVNLIR